MADKVTVEDQVVLKDPATEPEVPKGLTPAEINALLDKRVEALQGEFEAKYKSEIAGLNRKNTELEKVIKDRDDSKKTLEDRVREIEKEAQRKDRELATERLIRQLQAEAERRGMVLDDELPIDRINLSLEEGVEFLDKRKAFYEKRDAQVANKLMVGNTHVPGSGQGEADKSMPYDPDDTSFANMQKAIAAEEARMRKPGAAS